MRPLMIYFNELSSPCAEPDITPGAEWRERATTVFQCVREISRRQEDFDLAFVTGHWHGLSGGKPLSQWIKHWIGKGNYQWLLSRVKNVAPPALDCEVRFQNRKADGLTHAHLAESWVLSFPLPNSSWLVPDVAVIELCLGTDGLSERECVIKNLGAVDHVRHWGQELADWGRDLASNNVIATIAGFPLMMYPNDHGYAHVHLVDPSMTKEGRKCTLAKYRIDQFERMEGHPRWDSEIRPWIERHRTDLLIAWERCQQGGHPVQITD